MSLSDFESLKIEDFGGANLLVDQPDVKLPQALYAANVEYINGQVASRRGFGQAFDPKESAKNVTGAVNNGAGLIRLTVTAHGYSTGDLVIVASVGGVPAATGIWVATKFDANTIDLQGSIFAGTYTSGGTVYRYISATFALTNWLWSTSNYAVWFNQGSGVWRSSLASPANEKIMSVDASTGASAATFASSGARMYAAFFNSSSAGAAQGQVYSHGLGADNLFPAPLSTVGTMTEPGAGTVTAGAHRIAYLVEHRSGFITKYSPANASTGIFAPILFTAAGSKNARLTVGPITWPASAVKVHALMTPVDMPNTYYYVPNATDTVTGGASDTAVITFDVTDDDLTQSEQSQEETIRLNQLTQAMDGTGPFLPSVVCVYNNRLCYLTRVTDATGLTSSAVYISEAGDYESISANNHLVQAPGLRDISTLFVLRDTLYLAGPHATYWTRDNGSFPVTWVVQTVDGGKGTFAPRGVTVASKGDYAWVADESGLFIFDGSYPDLPASYYQTPDWQRINWNAAWNFQLVDNKTELAVYVLCPLDSVSAYPNGCLRWDYTNGIGPSKVKYSGPDSITGYLFGSIAIFQNDLAGMAAHLPKKLETWFGTSGQAPMLRKMSDADAQPWRDYGAVAIASSYYTGLFPGSKNGGIYQHWAARIRLKGSGSITPVVATLDAATTKNLKTLTLAANPSIIDLFKIDVRREGLSFRFSTSTLDTHWVLSSIEWFGKIWVQER